MLQHVSSDMPAITKTSLEIGQRQTPSIMTLMSNMILNEHMLCTPGCELLKQNVCC